MNSPAIVGGFEIKPFDQKKEAQRVYDLWERGRRRNFSSFWKLFNEPCVINGIHAKVYFHQNGATIVCPDTIGDNYDLLGDAYVEAANMLREVVGELDLSSFVSVHNTGSNVLVTATKDGRSKAIIATLLWKSGNIYIRMYSLSMIDLDVVLSFVQKVSVHP